MKRYVLSKMEDPTNITILRPTMVMSQERSVLYRNLILAKSDEEAISLSNFTDIELYRIEELSDILLPADEMLTSAYLMSNEEKEFLEAFKLVWDLSLNYGTGIEGLQDIYESWGTEHGFIIPDEVDELK